METDKPVDKRARLLTLVIDEKEDYSGTRLDPATIKALKKDIDRMPNRQVDRVLAQFEERYVPPGTARCVW